jgi:hypothetical protein
MFFDKILASTILLAYTAAQVKSGIVDAATQDTDYPLFAQFFAEGGSLEGYTWEAHKVATADGYVKVLFHLTGHETREFESNGKTVLVVNGAGTNAMALLAPDFMNNVYGDRATTRDAYNQSIKDLVDAEDPAVNERLTALKEALTEEQWSEFVHELEALDVNAEDVLATTTAPELDEAARACADIA